MVANGERKARLFSSIHLLFLIIKWKFVVCPFVDKETNKSYLFINELSGLMN
jgi:hypothetical protein